MNERLKATFRALAATGLLAVMIVAGSRNLAHFDAPLVGYTFAALFAVFGITYRYAMWLQRPATRLYWRAGWQIVLSRRMPRAAVLLRHRFVTEFLLNRLIWRRGRLRWGGHWLIMSGCVLAAMITFPLVFGWVHFQTEPGDLNIYRTYVFGFPTMAFAVDSLIAFVTFKGLVWAAILVIAGVMIAMWRRMRDHGAAAISRASQ